MTDGSVNDTPDYNHFKLLEEDYQAGTLHPAFHKIYHQMAEKYKRVTYYPPTHLAPTWISWREIRRTLPPTQAITYVDINAYFNVMDMRLSPHYIRLLMEYDYKFRVTYYELQDELQKEATPKKKSPSSTTSE